MELFWSHTLWLPPPSYHHVLFDARRFSVVTGHFSPLFVVVMHLLDISSAVFGPSVCSFLMQESMLRSKKISQTPTHFVALHQLMTKQMQQKIEVWDRRTHLERNFTRLLSQTNCKKVPTMLLCRRLREQLIQLFNISAPSLLLFLTLSKKNPEAAAKIKEEISYF